MNNYPSGASAYGGETLRQILTYIPNEQTPHKRAYMRLGKRARLRLGKRSDQSGAEEEGGGGDLTAEKRARLRLGKRSMDLVEKRARLRLG
jgi:hypothetical protein